jgi:hypothetical protein
MITTTETEWSWVTYKKLPFISKATGSTFYFGTFRKDIDMYSYDEQYVRFSSRHPIKAMRFICNSGKEPASFDYKEVK